jgi:DNA end-binding protein Ku
MSALNASVQQARASRGEDTGPAEVHELPKPKKKAPAKKQPAKKTAAKKPVAKKTTGGRRPRSA